MNVRGAVRYLVGELTRGRWREIDAGTAEAKGSRYRLFGIPVPARFYRWVWDRREAKP